MLAHAGREINSESVDGDEDDRGRTRSQLYGTFLSVDPIGFEGGDTNLYRYVGNSTLDYVDPLGFFRAKIVDKGGRSGPTYGGEMTITGDNGETITVPVSTHPNPGSAAPGIASGNYPGTYGPKSHKGQKPGIRLNDGGYVPTLGSNPAQGGNSIANGVNIHCGYSSGNRGSLNCITISPESCEKAFGVLQPGEQGTITIGR